MTCFQAKRGEVGEIRIVLYRVSAEVRRQIYTFRLEKSRKLWNHRVRGDVQNVRQLATGDKRRQLQRGVIRLRLNIDLQVNAKLLIDGLPQGVRFHRRRHGAGGPRDDADFTTTAGRLRYRLGRVRRIVDEGSVDQAIVRRRQVRLDVCEWEAVRELNGPAAGSRRRRLLHGRGSVRGRRARRHGGSRCVRRRRRAGLQQAGSSNATTECQKANETAPVECHDSLALIT